MCTVFNMWYLVCVCSQELLQTGVLSVYCILHVVCVCVWYMQSGVAADRGGVCGVFAGCTTHCGVAGDRSGWMCYEVNMLYMLCVRRFHGHGHVRDRSAECVMWLT